MTLETFEIEEWSGPFDPEMRVRAQTALEHGKLLYFPKLPFRLSNSENEFLDSALTDGRAKNISLDHTTGKLQGTSAEGERARRLAGMMERFGAGATGFIKDLLPNYGGVERARTSFRPVQVEDRPYSVIQDDRLLHVDAFPSRPMKNGRRILRFFANVAPQGGSSRHWQVGENFEDFAAKFAPGIRPHIPGKSWLLEKLGVTRARRSAYDEMMLSLHDATKRDAAYQKYSPRTSLIFPPGTTWLVYTDQVLHAALKGEFALEQTFHFDVAEMGEPDQAPIRVLERLTGKTLA
ncbi:MAG TPA: Kdo hydroxylase family protein [Rhizomicrobium sp.]|nr:Kdo hydroxylase family protein [Rhizomicrobium sp.]